MQAAEYWQRIDAELAEAQARAPTTIWVRQHWVANHDEDGCCPCDAIGNMVLRYKSAYPLQLSEFISPDEWLNLMADMVGPVESYTPTHTPAPRSRMLQHLSCAIHEFDSQDAADQERKSCISKGAGTTIFILLFYFTIFGIFFYMCCERRANHKRAMNSYHAKLAALKKWNSLLAARGVRIIARYHPLQREDEDVAVGRHGRVINDVPFLCIHLPRIPAPHLAMQLAYLPPQQGYPLQQQVQQQYQQLPPAMYYAQPGTYQQYPMQYPQQQPPAAGKGDGDPSAAGAVNGAGKLVPAPSSWYSSAPQQQQPYPMPPPNTQQQQYQQYPQQQQQQYPYAHQPLQQQQQPLQQQQQQPGGVGGPLASAPAGGGDDPV